GAQGKLTYRGIDIHDLARNSSFEETTYLLWFGSLPTRDALLKFSAELASHRVLPTQVLTLMKDFPRTATPMDALRTALSALAFYDPQTHDDARRYVLRHGLRDRRAGRSAPRGRERAGDEDAAEDRRAITRRGLRYRAPDGTSKNLRLRPPGVPYRGPAGDALAGNVA